VVLKETGETRIIKQVVFYKGTKNDHVFTKIITKPTDEIDNENKNSFFYVVENNGIDYPVFEDELIKE
jgi:hypothetical protein